MLRIAVAACVLVLSSSWAADPAAPVQPERRHRLAALEAGEFLPSDLTHPEGKTRWDLARLEGRAEVVREFAEAPDSAVVRDLPAGGEGGVAPREVRYTDLGPEGDAAAWVFPDRDRDGLRPGARRALRLETESGGTRERLFVETEIVGIGWLHLPSGPREVSLQRALVSIEPLDGSLAGREIVVHRWIDPLAGVVAEISGPTWPGGSERLEASSAEIVQEVLAGAADLKIYLEALWRGTRAGVNYGWDRGEGTAVSSLTTPGYSTVGELIAASTWNFSPPTSGSEVASTSTPIDASETCNFDQCGYTETGAVLERTDKNFDDPDTLDKTNDAAQREDRAADVTIWIRAGAQHEGKSGTFGDGESRFCYIGTDPNGKVRTQVPLWRFPHQDEIGWYMQAGDSWTSAAFNCEQNIFNQICGESQFLDKLWSAGKNVDSIGCGSHAGTQSGSVVKGGVVTLPSGHTFNALVLRTVADFCVYLGQSCSFLGRVDEVRTVVYLWQVPYLGSVVLLQSPQVVSDPTSFTTVDLTNITFGLYPPRSISAGTATETSVALSWDPGNDTHRVSSYKIYWDTDSGGASGYAFDSDANPGQVSFSGTTATVSGLERGTTYYFTVTSRSAYQDPSSGIVTTYESLVYPTQVYGDPSYVYPVEVQATTQCVPTAEVQGLLVSKSGGDVQLCWDPVADPCLTGYRILGSDTASSDAGFATIADTGPAETCWIGSPSQTYFLVVARGTGGTGPWGHYGH